MSHRREEDLYLPVKGLFESMGFAVKAEVLNCDAVAVRGESFVAVELKTKLNLEVILQAVDRQRFVDITYLAVFATGLPKDRKRLKAIEHLLRRLEIGFIVVDEVGDELIASIIFDGLPFDRSQSKRTNKKKSLALKKEFEKRLGDENIGGTTKRKRVTAYQQDVTGLALILSSGVRSTRWIREAYPYYSDKMQMLQNDHYGWFERVKIGHYQLSETGQAYVEQMEDHKKTSYLDRIIRFSEAEKMKKQNL